MQEHGFSTFVSEHDAVYRLTFFFVQSGLVCGAILVVGTRYKSALWTPQPSWKRSIAISVLIALPMFLYHLSSSVSAIQGVTAISSLGNEGRDAIASVYDEAWNRLAYGSSAAGVVCSSVLSFVAPVLEEIVFTGFVVNLIAKPCGFVAAVVGAPACFALMHVFQFGIGLHLIPLFLAGVTYASIRVCSGSLLLAVFGHWMINTVIFLPKWFIAVMHFSQV